MFLFSESKFFRSCNWQCFCHTLTAAELAPWTAQPLGEGLQGNRDKGVCTERTGVDFVLLITLQPLATSWVNKAMNSMVVACCSDLWAPVTVFPQPQVPSPPARCSFDAGVGCDTSVFPQPANHFHQTLHTENIEGCSLLKPNQRFFCREAPALFRSRLPGFTAFYFYCDFQLWWNQCTQKSQSHVFSRNLWRYSNQRS